MDTNKRIAITEEGGRIPGVARSAIVDRCEALMAGHGNVEGVVVRINCARVDADDTEYVIKVGVLLEGSRLYMRQERFCNVVVATIRVFARIEEHLKRRAELGEWRFTEARLAAF